MPIFRTFRFSAPLGFSLFLAACTASAPTGGNNDLASDPRPSAPGAAQCLTTSPAQVAAGVRATNQTRAQRGLPPVRASSHLTQAASQHACDMARRGVMGHGGSKTSGPAQRVKSLGYAPRVTAENIAAGPFSLERVLAEWNASSAHVANMMIPQVSEYGIGQAIGSDGRTRYWAAVYAAPR